MRIALQVDGELMERLVDAARARGERLEHVIDEVVRLGLDALDEAPRSRRYRCPAFSMGRPAIDLDKALMLASMLEDAETVARSQEFR